MYLKALYVHDIKLLVVPHFGSLSISQSFSRVLEDYFPIYKANYIPTRRFFWEVFGTLYHDEAKDFIAQEREARYQREEKQKERVIYVEPKILEALEAVNYFSKTKGRALFKMSAKAYPPTVKRRNPQHRFGSRRGSPFKRGREEFASDGRVTAPQHGYSGDKLIKIHKRHQPASSSHRMRTPGEKSKELLSDSQEQIRLSADK